MPTVAIAYDFKGVELGGAATPELIKEKLGVKCGAGKAPYLYICNGYTTIASAPAFMNLVIGESGNVSRIGLLFKSDRYLEVFIAMKQKYGQPTKTDESLLQNSMGATFHQAVHIWEDGSNTIKLKKYASKITDSSVHFSTQEDSEVRKELIEKRLEDI